MSEEVTTGSPRTRLPDQGPHRRLHDVRVDPRHHLPTHQLLNVLDAARYTRLHLRKPLNTYLVIAFATARGWVHGRRTDAEHGAVRERFLKALRDWFSRKGVDPIFVYSDENPPSGGIGPHLNVVLHLPEEGWAELRADLFRCMRNAGGWGAEECPDAPRDPTRRRGVLVQPTAAAGPMLLQQEEATVAYILKAAHPDMAVEIDGRTTTLGDLRSGPSVSSDLLIERLKPQGDVRSRRRAGSSLPIGETARRRVGWIDSCTIAELSWGMRMRLKVAQVMKSVALSGARVATTVPRVTPPTSAASVR